MVKKSSKVKDLYCAPGNAGMNAIAECVSIPSDDSERLLKWALDNDIDLTLVGPEAPLVKGIVDLFKAKGLRVFGPDKYASQLEGSKLFSKKVMKKLGVPTAAFECFDKSADALAYLNHATFPLVVKADGLAAGKGVTVAQTKEEAQAAVKQAMDDKIFGAAGQQVIIEKCLQGEEASLIAISDGKTVLNFASSQDHKRIFDGDQGPNTGGMGAYSPAPLVTKAIEKEACERVFQPVIDEMRAQGHPFVGFLYAGLMINAKGFKVLEFNVRFGDPEAQVVLTRLETDFLELIEAAVDQRLDSIELKWKEESAVTVVLAAAGYPGTVHKGDVITGVETLANDAHVFVFHAGTGNQGDTLITAGGRVLNVVAFGDGIGQAVERVYEAVKKISFSGMQYRKDIAHRALGSGKA